MGSTGVVEEPISSELVLVDPALARRARAALPDPPWLLPALAELQERTPAEPAAAPVLERPARPSGQASPAERGIGRPRRRRSRGHRDLVSLAFVPLSRGPSFVTTAREAGGAIRAAPPANGHTTSSPTTKPKSTQPQRTTKPKKTRQNERPAATTRTKRRESKPAAGRRSRGR